VLPALDATTNERVPDLAVICSHENDPRYLLHLVILIEILSPSNAAITRANVWAYRTIASAREIVLIHSTRILAELLRRDADGEWPSEPQIVEDGGELRLNSIGFTVPLHAIYRTTSLVSD
jgi:Uma2 family endonuclease